MQQIETFFNPCISLTQGISGMWHATTFNDDATLATMGVILPYAGIPTESIDDLLETVSNAGYSLETVPAER